MLYKFNLKYTSGSFRCNDFDFICIERRICKEIDVEMYLKPDCGMEMVMIKEYYQREATVLPPNGSPSLPMVNGQWSSSQMIALGHR